MKKQYQKIKPVALAISPLILSFTVIFFLWLLLGSAFGGYFSALNLFLSEGGGEIHYETNNIFEGYQGTGEQEETIDGNSIQYPKRGDLYAQLSIEKCQMTTDVYFDDSNEALSKGGVGQYYGTRPFGYGSPILICGHNNGKFNSLQYVAEGDLVTVTTNYGIYQYRITSCEIRPASDFKVGELKQDEETLILYTCYPFTALGLTNQRFFVFAEKISGPRVLQ